MTSGPTHIMKAPGCVRPVKVETIGSGSLFRATFWTDGKTEVPMSPDYPWLRKSPSENVLFWLDECEEIGQIDPFDRNGNRPEWADLDFAEEPEESDYFQALTNGIAGTPEKVRYVRIRLWWKGNDPIRRDQASELTASHRENLADLLQILPKDVPDWNVMRAEIMRELSRFEEALKVLDSNFPVNYASNFPVNYASIFPRIRELAQSGESRVAQFSFPLRVS